MATSMYPCKHTLLHAHKNILHCTQHTDTQTYVYTGLYTYKNTHIWTICGLFGSDFNLAVGHTYVRSFASHPNLKLMLHSRKI